MRDLLSAWKRRIGARSLRLRVRTARCSARREGRATGTALGLLFLLVACGHQSEAAHRTKQAALHYDNAAYYQACLEPVESGLDVESTPKHCIPDFKLRMSKFVQSWQHTLGSTYFESSDKHLIERFAQTSCAAFQNYSSGGLVYAEVGPNGYLSLGQQLSDRDSNFVSSESVRLVCPQYQYDYLVAVHDSGGTPSTIRSVQARP